MLTENTLLAPVHVGRKYKLKKIDLIKVHIDAENSFFGASQISTDAGDEIVIPSFFIGWKCKQSLLVEIMKRRELLVD